MSEVKKEGVFRLKPDEAGKPVLDGGGKEKPRSAPKSVREKILIISLVLNVLFIADYAIEKLNSPEYRGGVLRQDVTVYFQRWQGQDREVIPIIIPKGLTVRDASPRGFNAIALFEPNRFKIIFTSEDRNLVNYIDYKNHIDNNLFGFYPVAPVLESKKENNK